ncbi:MAG TPA: hypothetical protein VF541_03515 [Longimicrobium sp.]|jgi:hypothetical protein
MAIHLTPGTESALAREAEARGTTPDLLAEEYVINGLRTEIPAPNGPQPETLAERLKDFIGVLHSSEHVPGRARMSECTGEKVAAPGQEPKSLADSLSAHIGVLGSAEFGPEGAHLSEDTGRRFTEALVRQREQGRL